MKMSQNISKLFSQQVANFTSSSLIHNIQFLILSYLTISYEFDRSQLSKLIITSNQVLPKSRCVCVRFGSVYLAVRYNYLVTHFWHVIMIFDSQPTHILQHHQRNFVACQQMNISCLTHTSSLKPNTSVNSYQSNTQHNCISRFIYT